MITIRLTFLSHLAKDEMDTINEDRWNEDIWGVEHKGAASETPPPKLVFYFGENVSLSAPYFAKY